MVHHVHGDQWYREFPYWVGRFGWFLESQVVPWLYRHKRVITVSPTTEEELHKIGFKAQQISVIFNGLEVKIPLPRSESPTPRIAYVGRIKAYKRIDLLVRAVHQLRHEFPDLHLDIAGTGDGIGQLKKLIDDLGLQSHVTLHGYVDEATKAHLLASATLFATPSMQEGWGLSVIEANAYGCPAVAYNVPGLSAAIPNNETGLLANTHAEFIEAMARIIRDEALRQRLSRGAIFWASMFSWEYSALSTISVLADSRV